MGANRIVKRNFSLKTTGSRSSGRGKVKDLTPIAVNIAYILKRKIKNKIASICRMQNK